VLLPVISTRISVTWYHSIYEVRKRENFLLRRSLRHLTRIYRTVIYIDSSPSFISPLLHLWLFFIFVSPRVCAEENPFLPSGNFCLSWTSAFLARLHKRRYYGFVVYVCPCLNVSYPNLPSRIRLTLAILHQRDACLCCLDLFDVR